MYPIDRRVQAAYIHSLGHSIRKTAILLNVSSSTVHRWLHHPHPKTYIRNTPSKTSRIVESIRIALLNDPFLTCVKLRDLIQQLFNFKVSTTLIHTTIRKSGMTKKKARRFSSPDNLPQKTQDFLTLRNTYLRENRIFVSLDETSFGRNGVQTMGYAPRGEKLLLKRPAPTIQTTSVMAVASQDRLIHWESRRGSYDSESFCDYLDRLQLPDKVVILLDNARFHHSKRAAEIITAKGWTFLFTPPYSPWFNPIEEVFSIVKRHYYKCLNVQDSFQIVTSKHCHAFFRHSMALKGMPIS